MQTQAVFHLWQRLHQDLLRFLDLVPDGDLSRRAAGHDMDLGMAFRHVASVEDYWRRVVLEPGAEYREIADGDCADLPSLRDRLGEVFAATERLLAGSRVDALLARPVDVPFPVANGLEALTLAHLHTVHHRAQIAAQLAALGVATEDWL